MSRNVRPYKVRGMAEYLVTHGKSFKDQGIEFDRNCTADTDEQNNEINEESLLLSGTNEPEPHIDNKVNNITNEPQPGCSHWNNSLNDTDKEGESHNCNREGEVEFGATFIGDRIEIDLEPQNVHRPHESQQKKGPVSEREEHDQMRENRV